VRLRAAAISMAVLPASSISQSWFSSPDVHRLDGGRTLRISARDFQLRCFPQLEFAEIDS
jgi:hypothetical protein